MALVAVLTGVLLRATLLTGSLVPLPTATPSVLPTVLPTAVPTVLPTPLPTSLPTALPSVLPTAVPSILPTALGTIVPTILPSATPTPAAGGPTPTPAASPGAPAGSGGGAGAGAAGGGSGPGSPAATDPTRPLAARSQAPPGTLMSPIQLPPGPAGQAIAAGLVFLPLLLGIWLLILVRTLGAAALLRSAALRLHLAADLGIRPRELTAMTPESLARVRDEVVVDELTGVLRRATGVAALERELARARRHQRPLVAGFVDADGLKRVNDSQGHVAGDALLHGIAEAIQSRLRAEDVVFRYGGDEFVCLLPETELEAARKVFEEMLAKAREQGRSFSYGLAAAAPSDDAVTLLGRADQELYDGRERRKAAGGQADWREGKRRPLVI